MPRPARLGLLLALGLPLLVAAHRAPAPGAVAGVVRDAETGDPLPGANVALEGTSLGASTDGAGRFEIAGVPAGRYRLRASFVGYGAETVDVEVASGETARVDLALGSGGALSDVVVTGESASDGRSASPRPAARSAESISGDAASSGVAEDMALDASPAAAPPPPPTPESSERPARERRERPAPGLLTAGDVDDGLNWDAYLGYVRRTLGARGGGQGRGGAATPDLGLSDRVVLRVVDAAGHPVAGARVEVRAEGGARARRLVTEAGTDGRLALFPAYDFGPGARALRLDVRRPGGGGQAVSETVRLGRLGEDRTVRVRLPIRVAERPRALDLAFVIDVTGSMGDELRYLTDEFESIVERVERRYPGVDLRFGLVAYRDRGDAFVVRRHDFTRSAREMRQRLAALRADGGGDYPEAMDEALEAALDLDWRTGTAARVAFVVADAPPHPERTARALDAVREARARGLRLYPVAASGVADEAEYVLRATAVLTQARYTFLTDDSGVGLPHAEPKVACYEVTPLDNLLVRVVASELEGRRVEASADEVLRTVGDPDRGVCEGQVLVQRPDRPARRGGELGYDGER